MDAWDGYPAARARLLKAAREADADLLVLAGDSHNAWGFDLDHGKDARRGEFAGQSVTSPGARKLVAGGSSPTCWRAILVGRNPAAEVGRHPRRGYLARRADPQVGAPANSASWTTVRETGDRAGGNQADDACSPGSASSPLELRLNRRAAKCSGDDAALRLADDYHHPGSPGADRSSR